MLYYIFVKSQERYELKRRSDLFITCSVARPPSPSEVILFGSPSPSDVILFWSAVMHVASCHVEIERFLTAHLRGNGLIVKRDMGEKKQFYSMCFTGDACRTKLML
jgi:hypothetical protein